MKVSFKVKSPANIALVKYWGRQDELSVLPSNKSLSFNLSDCYTVSEFIYGDFMEDAYEYDGDTTMAVEQIKRVREFFMRRGTLIPFVKVISKNSFPSSCGIASSASSMSALTFGLFELAKKFGGDFQRSDLIEMTRLSGSASAVRSLGAGLVLYDPNKPDLIEEHTIDHGLYDFTVIVDSSIKKVSSSQGHRIALSSSLYEERVENVDERINDILDTFCGGDFDAFGELIEVEAISFLLNHYTSDPRLQYLLDKSLEVIYFVKRNKIPAYFTFDAGANVHLISDEDISDLLEGYFEFVKNSPQIHCQIL